MKLKVVLEPSEDGVYTVMCRPYQTASVKATRLRKP